jgi:hypothetical protein
VRGGGTVGGKREGGLRDDDDIVPEGGGPLVGSAVPDRTLRRLHRHTDTAGNRSANPIRLDPTQFVRVRGMNRAADRNAHRKLRPGAGPEAGAAAVEGAGQGRLRRTGRGRRAAPRNRQTRERRG